MILLDLITNNSNSRPWLLIGEFNIVLSMDEKVGGDRNPNMYMVNFAIFLRDGHLITLNVAGVPFTWLLGVMDIRVVLLSMKDWIEQLQMLP